MIARVYEKALQACPHVYVATDDERIEQAVHAVGGNVVMTPAELPSGTDRVAYAARELAQAGLIFDVIVNVQGDEPFIDPQQIRQLAECFADSSVQIATLAKPILNKAEIFDPNKPKIVFGANGKALYFSRSPIPYIRGAEEQDWQARHQFHRHIGIYAYRWDSLQEIAELPVGVLEQAEMLEQLRWLEAGYSIAVAITLHESPAVDTPADLDALRSRLGEFGA